MPGNWKRNTSGILASVRQKRESALQRTDEAIKLLLKENKLISFNAVAETAKVTVGWLYKQSEIKDRILTLRVQQTAKVEIPKQERVTEVSKDKMVENLKHRVREQNSEIKRLSERLEKAYGLIRCYEETIEELKTRLGEPIL